MALAFQECQRGYGVRCASRLEGKEANNPARDGGIGALLVTLCLLPDLDNSKPSLLGRKTSTSTLIGGMKLFIFLSASCTYLSVVLSFYDIPRLNAVASSACCFSQLPRSKKSCAGDHKIRGSDIINTSNHLVSRPTGCTFTREKTLAEIMKWSEKRTVSRQCLCLLIVSWLATSFWYLLSTNCTCK